jgi:hypothetical protein
MAFLEAISAPDIQILIEGQDFVATQDMTEEIRQEITYRGGFGVDGPVLRSIRNADNGTISFSAVLTKVGVQNGLNSEHTLKLWRDFSLVTTKGRHVVTYRNCNWERLSVRATLTEVTIDADIQVPNMVNAKVVVLPE